MRRHHYVLGSLQSDRKPQRMDQTWSGSSQVLVRQQCASPDISRESDKTLSYRTVNLLNDGSILKQGNCGNAELREGLLTIWAILLRFYTVNNIVTFLLIAAIPDHFPSDVTTNGEPKAVPQCSRTQVYYDIPNHIHLCDVKVASNEFHKSGETNVTVKTAIVLSKAPCLDTAGSTSVLRDLLPARDVCLDPSTIVSPQDNRS